MLLKLQLSGAEIVQGGHEKNLPRLSGRGRLEGSKRPLIAQYLGTNPRDLRPRYACLDPLQRYSRVKLDVRSGG